MKMIDWIKNLLHSSDHDEHVTLQSVKAPVDPEMEEVVGLNFKTAIEVHVKWKGRLSNYIVGKSQEPLDAKKVCRDDECVLGKWIYGIGGVSYSGSKLFEELKVVHARFHTCAGQVITEVDHGNKEGAVSLLNGGDYIQASQKVTNLLAQLYMQSRQREPA